MKLFETIRKKYEGYIYFLFRILVGGMFMVHGGQKLFGWLGFTAQPLVSTMGLAGIIEFFGGLLVLLGLFTRLVAIIASLEMLLAYFMAHFGNGWFPNVNGGELAVLYFVAFLIMVVYGNGKWNLEKLILKKEVF